MKYIVSSGKVINKETGAPVDLVTFVGHFNCLCAALEGAALMMKATSRTFAGMGKAHDLAMSVLREATKQ